MKIIPLGTKGYIPTYGRHTMSFMMYDDQSMFIIDAGTGLSRLNETLPKNVINRYGEINVVLSHYHLDHIVGIPYLAGIMPNNKFNIYLPSSPFVDIEGCFAMDKFLNPPFFSIGIRDFPNFNSAIEVKNSVLEIDHHKFEFIRLNHDGGSMGIKINESISYITDTVTNERVSEFIRNSKIVLHEVWMIRDEMRSKPNDALKHSVYEDVIEVMKKSDISKLVPVHLNPNWTEDEIVRIFTRNFKNGIDIILPIEGKIIEF